MKQEIKKITKGIILFDEPMSKHTSYGIGGPARAYITPKNKEDLVSILKFSKDNNIPSYFIGSGSNLLVSDEGIDGIVITLGKSFNKLEINKNNVFAETGVMLGRMVKECAKRNLSGIESLIGVPGTLGGALIMNAGAFGGEISNYLEYVSVITMSGDEKKYQQKDIKFNYRNSSFSDNEILINANFKFILSDQKTVSKNKLKASGGRKSSQPLRFRSAGSVFKNPSEGAAGYFIDKAGLKGTKSGDAEISSVHANFFVNHGRATAKDVIRLINIARKKVYKEFGVMLELEIKTLGFAKEVIKT
ncbi:MAG: UDP-N-acetylmuramate dehydrogenase [Candidatus Neomarinimicrobiota bacterium]|tara:strand:- start:430 stop:1341 length:912 start_codon:yes stop_codon:yes gene_type:complete